MTDSPLTQFGEGSLFHDERTLQFFDVLNQLSDRCFKHLHDATVQTANGSKQSYEKQFLWGLESVSRWNGTVLKQECDNAIAFSPALPELYKYTSLRYIREVYKSTNIRQMKVTLPTLEVFLHAFYTRVASSDIMMNLQYFKIWGIEKKNLIMDCIRYALFDVLRDNIVNDPTSYVSNFNTSNFNPTKTPNAVSSSAVEDDFSDSASVVAARVSTTKPQEQSHSSVVQSYAPTPETPASSLSRTLTKTALEEHDAAFEPLVGNNQDTKDTRSRVSHVSQSSKTSNAHKSVNTNNTNNPNNPNNPHTGGPWLNSVVTDKVSTHTLKDSVLDELSKDESQKSKGLLNTSSLATPRVPISSTNTISSGNVFKNELEKAIGNNPPPIHLPTKGQPISTSHGPLTPASTTSESKTIDLNQRVSTGVPLLSKEPNKEPNKEPKLNKEQNKEANKAVFTPQTSSNEKTAMDPKNQDQEDNQSVCFFKEE